MPWYEEPAQPLNEAARTAAKAHQAQLTKPPGALGRLETLAEQFAAWQGLTHPQCEQISIRVFAGDHGVCAQGVSPFPQEVTGQMIVNFCSGGAAISVLAKQLGADFSVVNMGIATDMPLPEDVVDVNLMPGTRDFTTATAMDVDTVEAAMAAGRDQVPSSAQLCIGGEMGIGNTTAASALYSALLDVSPDDTVGPGAGSDDAGQARKREVIAAAIERHDAVLGNAVVATAAIGGLEIAGLAGYYIGAAQAGIPVLVDGFIATAAALVAVRTNPSVRDWMIFAHRSAEPAHHLALADLEAEPLLDIGMRLGEGSGAAAAVPLLQAALNLHNAMATFADAGVADAG